jgi:hypothetical protein
MVLKGSYCENFVGRHASSSPTSVHLRKFNLLMLHCLKHGFPSYVDAPRQEGSILNGDARDYDVSI